VLRNRRKTLGLSQAELARRADVGRQWLVAVEQGKMGAELGLVLRTLAALGLRLAVVDPDAPGGALDDRLAAVDLDAVIAAARGEPP
jgi:HTH-type transcriptional regulator/antitoxin HipB